MNTSKEKCIIVIPCYNEENRLDLNQFTNFSENNDNISFLFVNDGSQDSTSKILKDFCQGKSNFNFLDLSKNVGKALAIREGVLSINENEFDFVGYFDADLATPLSEISNLLETTRHLDPIFILGTRIKLLGYSEISRKPIRHYIGRIFATVVSNLIKLPIYDTQCGAKLIKAEITHLLFEAPFVSRWLFDVELLFRLKKMFSDAESKIVEVPLKKWDDVDGSKIKLSYYFQAPFDLFRIYLKYNNRT